MISPGLGRGLIAAYLQRPDSRVIACVRNPKAAEADLEELPRAEGSELIVLKLDCKSNESAAEAAYELQNVHHVSQINVVVANAAMAANYGPMSTMQLEHLQEHMMVNAYSVLLLFQAMKPLLEQAPAGQAKFVLIGAPISTITEMEGCARAPLGAYGASKLAGNYFVRKLHFENKWLIAFVIDPG